MRDHEPFDRIEDVIAESELRAVLDDYKRVAGYSDEKLVGSAREAQKES